VALLMLVAPSLMAQCSPTGPTPGNCASYEPLYRKYGLPVSTFRAIAWRESGCNHTIFTDNSTDLGGYLLGLNFRTAQLRAGWWAWCQGTVTNLRYDPDHQVRCAAAAYQRMGLAPWR
jgi:hypothetical protein